MTKQLSSSIVSASSTRRRTHLNHDQLDVLQKAFVSNPLPDSTTRGQLALDLGVTERTVQIWFQNRRAKARKLEALANSLGVTLPNESGLLNTSTTRYQATFRMMMTPSCFEHQQQQDKKTSPQTTVRPQSRPRSISKPEPKSNLLLTQAQMPLRAMSEGPEEAMLPGPTENFKAPMTPLVTFPIQVIRIGTWTRLTQTMTSDGSQWDLWCYGDTLERQLIWQVWAQGHQFRIHVPFDAISQMHLCSRPDAPAGWDGQLDIAIDPSALTYSMWRQNHDNTWVGCGDFTEDRQATQQSIHDMQGSYDALQQVLTNLIALAPELASKVIVLSPLVGPAEDMSLSPSSTPEPHSANSVFPTIFSKQNDSQPLMLQEPFYYGTEMNAYPLLQQPQEPCHLAHQAPTAMLF